MEMTGHRKKKPRYTYMDFSWNSHLIMILVQRKLVRIFVNKTELGCDKKNVPNISVKNPFIVLYCSSPHEFYFAELPYTDSFFKNALAHCNNSLGKYTFLLTKNPAKQNITQLPDLPSN